MECWEKWYIGNYVNNALGHYKDNEGDYNTIFDRWNGNDIDLAPCIVNGASVKSLYLVIIVKNIR